MILIALGSNLPSRYGDSDKTVLAAIEKMELLGLTVCVASRIWHTRPVPASDQPPYSNAVVSIKTALDAEALMVLLHAIEVDFGRVRSGVLNEARVLDLDILAYNHARIDVGGLVVPHPRLQERGFVLYPLREVAPDWQHPVLGLSVDQMIAALEVNIRTVETVAA